jgi:hypothetical protein
MKTFDNIMAAHRAQALRPFQSPALRPLKLVFNVERLRDRLDFSFVLSGRVPADIESLVMPKVREPLLRKRQDELWKSTCLEVFVASVDRDSYLEINLSPSGDWNVYAFDKYRAGMRPASDPHPPMLRVEPSVSGDSLTWHGALRLQELGRTVDLAGELSEILSSPGLVTGATAVLEYKSGEREYWALAHAGKQPDFHLRESFRLPL